MVKVKSLADLKNLKDRLSNKVELREKGENIENLIQIKISMATCGIASGAKEVMNSFLDEISKNDAKNIVVTQTGCMGYCYCEPTIEVLIPSKEPVVFGYVDVNKAKDIFNKYIMKGELVDGIIPITYQTVDNN